MFCSTPPRSQPFHSLALALHLSSPWHSPSTFLPLALALQSSRRPAGLSAAQGERRARNPAADHHLPGVCSRGSSAGAHLQRLSAQSAVLLVLMGLVWWAPGGRPPPRDPRVAPRRGRRPCAKVCMGGGSTHPFPPLPSPCPSRALGMKSLAYAHACAYPDPLSPPQPRSTPLAAAPLTPDRTLLATR